jgi:hypothetical protein
MLHRARPAPSRSPARRPVRRRAVPLSGRLALALLLAQALAGLLAGCALQPTPYQPLGEAGGYEETRLGERVYRVSFRGNRATAETAVLDFLYLRCAELTQQAGYTHFVIQENFGRTQLNVQALPRSSVGVGMGFGSSRSFWGLGFNAPLGEPDVQATISYHLGVFVIRMLNDAEARQAEAADKGQVYDAGYLLRSLEPKKEASLRKDS